MESVLVCLWCIRATAGQVLLGTTAAGDAQLHARAIVGTELTSSHEDRPAKDSLRAFITRPITTWAS